MSANTDGDPTFTDAYNARASLPEFVSANLYGASIFADTNSGRLVCERSPDDGDHLVGALNDLLVGELERNEP